MGRSGQIVMTRDEKMFVLDDWSWGHAAHARKDAESLTRYAEGAMALSEIVDVSLAAVSLPLLSWSPLTANDKVVCLKYNNPSSCATLLLLAHTHPRFPRIHLPAF